MYLEPEECELIMANNMSVKSTEEILWIIHHPSAHPFDEVQAALKEWARRKE